MYIREFSLENSSNFNRLKSCVVVTEKQLKKSKKIRFFIISCITIMTFKLTVIYNDSRLIIKLFSLTLCSFITDIQYTKKFNILKT